MIDTCLPASHLRIAVPCYTGHVTADTSHSLNEATLALRDAGIQVSFDYACGNCYIENVRNMLVTRFLQSDATDLLFVDADVGFAPVSVLQIAAARRPFIAGIYPKKNDDTAFPVSFPADILQADDDGYLEAALVPTGFLRLNRAVFDAMPYENYVDHPDLGLIRGYFQCGPRNGQYWGEDANFCRVWRELGGKVYIIPEMTFAHNGPKAWKGNWGEWQRGRMRA